MKYYITNKGIKTFFHSKHRKHPVHKTTLVFSKIWIFVLFEKNLDSMY